MLEGKMKLTGRVALMQVRGGRILHVQEGENLVVSAGRKLIRNIVRTVGASTKPTHMSVGDDGTAADPADTALGNELAAITRGGISENIGPTSYSLTYYLAAGITNDTAGAAQAKEIGIFNAGAAGDMLARFICQEFTYEIGDVLYINWILTFGD